MTTGTESRFQKMKLLAEELEVGGNSVTGDDPVAGDIAVTAPGTDATWTDVQAALDDIASRLATLEAA